MKTVILTAGPQGAGKSTYCKRAIEAHPDVQLISRDDLLIEFYGRVWLDPYSGGHTIALEEMWRRVEKAIRGAMPDFTMLLDCFNGSFDERAGMIRKLRYYGAERVMVWYFVTPLPTCLRWCAEREDRRQQSDCERDYRLYHTYAVDLRKWPEEGWDGLSAADISVDRVVRIDPTDLQLFPDVFPL